MLYPVITHILSISVSSEQNKFQHLGKRIFQVVTRTNLLQIHIVHNRFWSSLTIGRPGILNSSFTSLSQHFEGKAIMMALSFASLGTGVGAMCIPLLLQFCKQTTHWSLKLSNIP
jgi:hypothetical protein